MEVEILFPNLHFIVILNIFDFDFSRKTSVMMNSKTIKVENKKLQQKENILHSIETKHNPIPVWKKWADAKNTPLKSSGLHILVFQDRSKRGVFNMFQKYVPKTLQ